MSTIGDTTTTTAINAMLKVQQKRITEHFNAATVLLKQIKGKAGKEINGGRSVELPQDLMPNTQIAGVRGDDGAWSKGARGITGNATVPIYAHDTSQYFGHLAELKTKADVQAIRSVVEQVSRDIQVGFPRSINKLLFLTGNGVLARANGAPAGLVITVDAEAAGLANSFGTHYWERGMHFHATSDNTLTDPDRLVDAQVVAVGTNTLTVEGNIAGLVDNDWLCLQDMLNNCTEGLLSGIGDGTTNDHGATYLGIDRSLAANSYWRSTVVDMNSAGSIENTLVGAVMNADKQIGAAPRMCITEYEVYNNLWQSLVSGRQFFSAINSGDSKSGATYAIGFTRIMVDTPVGRIEIFYDKDCPRAEAFIINPDDWFFAFIDGKAPLGGWYVDESGNYIHQVSETYRKGVNWLANFNFVCRKPLGQVRLSEVPRTALV